VSPHARRVLALRLAMAALALAYPAAWAAGRLRAAGRRIRYGRGPQVPGLPADGEPLDRDEMRDFIAVVQCWKYPALPERTRHP